MSVANKPSRSPVANGGFGDPDLTPKPLRILKREQQTRTSTANTVDSSLSIHKSQTQGNLQALAPSKKCINRVNSTLLDLSLQDLAAPTSQWARRNTFLHVHKQRQSEPIDANTAALIATYKEPIGLLLPARSRNSCPTMNQLGKSSDAGKAITVARPASIRAVTTGNYRSQNPLSPVHEVSSSPSASSAALRTSQRRAVTNVEAFCKDLDTFDPVPHRKIRKQSSSKNSLMSRVMNGFTNRNHVSHAASRGGYGATRAPPNSSPAALSRTREDWHAFRQSDSSTETDNYCGRNLQNARAAYPTPPTSSATSSTTAGSIDSRHSTKPQRFRELCKPADVVLMGADLTLTPEYNELSSEKGRSMWVSLDIKGTTNSTSVQDVWSQHTGLDVVVVIDNSLHTSPAALMASCETARFLASILNRVTDRLAILCTSVTHTGGADSKVVRGLSEVHMNKIKTDLDAITNSSEKLKANAWIDTIDCAKEMLLNSTVPDPDEELLQDTFGHIFLLTPDADGLPSRSLAHEELTFHIICPTSVHRNDGTPIHCNGWKLRSLSEKQTQVVSKRQDFDPTSVTNRLRVLISQARSGKLLGNLTELVLEVSAGPDCILEGVIGNVNFTELHPGEVFTALLRLTVRDAVVQEYSLSGSPAQSSEALLNTTDVLGQLDKMLGPTDAKILTARLTYKHSLLPAGTTCSVTTECHVKRRPPDPDQEPSPSKSDFLPAGECTVLVEKRLAYHLATQGSPRNALQTLHNEFGDRFQFSACRDYLNLLAKELKYQARIVERQQLDASPQKKPPSIPTAKSSSESCSQNSFRAETHKPQQRATSDIPTEELFKTKPALAVLTLKESREQLRTDEARRIWGDLRKMKRPPDQTTKGRSISSQVEEARRLGIRELAVRNKRSVGSDTLRSIFSGGESVGKGLGAPWM